MHLVHLSVRDLRPFADVSLALPETGLVLLAGPNNSGKSALLLAFDVLAGENVKNLTRQGGTGPATVCGRFLLNDDERLALFREGFKDLSGWISSDSFRELSLTYQELPGFDVPVLAEATTNLGTDQSLTICALRKADASGNASYNVANWQWLRDVSVSVAQTVERPEQVTSEGYETGAREQYLQSLREPLALWRRQFFHFAPVRPGTNSRRELRSEDKLAIDGANLPEVLLSLRNNQEDVFDAVKSALNQAVPGAGDLKIRSSSAEVWLSTLDPNYGAEVNLKDLGSGIEQLLMAAVVGIGNPAGSVTLLEEPEASLHPGAQRQLALLLREWGKQQLIVATTHSPVLLELDGGQSQTVSVSRSDGVSELSAGLDEPADVLSALGVRLSDVLSAERLLLVEGKSDALVYRAWFGDEFDRHRVAVIGLGGGDAVWSAQAIEKALEGAGTLKQPMLIVRDRDELDPESIDRLCRLPRVAVLDRREIENFLLEPSAINVALDLGMSDEYVTVDEIRRVADSLRDTVLLKRVAARLKPIRPLDRRVVNELKGVPLSAATVASRASQQVPLRDDLASQIETIFDEERAALDEIWDQQLLQLAPGEEILTQIYAARSRHFDKVRDAAQIGLAMQSVPPEVRAIVERLLQA